MNKFKRKPVPFSPIAIGRQMRADALRLQKKLGKQQPVEFGVRWLGNSATAISAGSVESG